MEATRNTRALPEDRFVRPEQASHRTFYRGPGVNVTDRWLTVADRRYAVAELDHPRTVRQPMAGFARASSAAAVIVGAVVVAGAVAGEPTLLVGAPIAVAVPVGIAVAARLRRRYFALVAEYRGETVELFGASDERRFNQICRALLRAREYGRDHTA
jgi:hypothetical protein